MNVKIASNYLNHNAFCVKNIFLSFFGLKSSSREDDRFSRSLWVAYLLMNGMNTLILKSEVIPFFKFVLSNTFIKPCR